MNEFIDKYVFLSINVCNVPRRQPGACRSPREEPSSTPTSTAARSQ